MFGSGHSKPQIGIDSFDWCGTRIVEMFTLLAGWRDGEIRRQHYR